MARSLGGDMDAHDQPLIVGAGPVGLSAALFLTGHGLVPRVVEQRREPSRHSKALAVNPRTLEILKPTGLTRLMLERGLPIRGVRFYRRGRPLAGFSLDGIHPDYPFMLALSQAATERLLASALEAAGGKVERGLELVDCRSLDRGVEAVLQPLDGGPAESVQCPWLLAADGAHSQVRRRMKVAFPGSSFKEDWHLADVPLATGLAPDHAHIFLLPGSRFLFLIRVVDDVDRERDQAPLWRVIGNFPEPLTRLPLAEPRGEPRWASSFHVSHRLAATLASGGVYFAGDAAHIHSPLGARGMNLGIEDAWVFAQLALGRPPARIRPAEKAGGPPGGAPGGAAVPGGERRVVAVAVLEDLYFSCGPQASFPASPHGAHGHRPRSPVAGFLK